MTQPAERTVLQRKLKAAQPAPVLSAMTPKKAIRLAVARAGEAALGCSVTLVELTESQGPPDELAKALPDQPLCLRLESACGARGLAVLCPQAVGAIIEAQTMGRVLAAKSPDRTPTRTDAMLVGGFIDQVLTGAASLLSGSADAPPLAGLMGAGPVADVRAGLMTLTEAVHLAFALDLDFAGGAKAGRLHLLLPAASAKVVSDPADGGWTRKLGQAVLGSQTRLEAVLCRQRLPLSRVAGLAVGDLLRLDAVSLDRIALRGPDGRVLMTARLGRSGGSRALRLVLSAEGPSKIAQEADAKAAVEV